MGYCHVVRVDLASPSEKKEVAKRRTMQERLGRLPRLATNCPQLEHAPIMHWAMLLRRFKKYYPVAEYVSQEVIQHVLNEDFGIDFPGSVPDVEQSPVDLSKRSEVRAFKMAMDPDATESSSDEEDDVPGPSVSRDSRFRISRKSASFRFLREQIELCAQDLHAAYVIEECDREIEATRQQLMELRKRKASVLMNSVEKECSSDEESARCRPYSCRIRRKLVKLQDRNVPVADVVANSLESKERVLAYSLLDDRVHPDLSLLSAVPLERRMQTYIRRRSTRPLKFLRQRWDRAAWKSKTYFSTLKEHVEQQESKRDLFEQGKDVSDDGEYSCLRRARRNNHSNKSVSPLKRAGKRLVKRSLDQKRNGERYSNSRSRARHLERRRASAVPRVFREFNYEDSSLQEPGLPGLPPKFDYKEICIPPWKYAPLDFKNIELDVPCAHYAEGATTAEVSRRHLPLELSERKRFQQYRDYVASKSAGAAGSLTTDPTISKISGSSGPASKITGNGGTVTASSLESASSACSRAQSPTALSSVEEDRHGSTLDVLVIPEYDRPSLATPYSPRHFPLSSPICQDSP